MTFREDESRIRRGNAPHDIGVIRHMAMNPLKREKTKLSYGKKRIRAALDDTFRDKFLIGQCLYMRSPCYQPCSVCGRASNDPACKCASAPYDDRRRGYEITPMIAEG